MERIMITDDRRRAGLKNMADAMFEVLEDRYAGMGRAILTGPRANVPVDYVGDSTTAAGVEVRPCHCIGPQNGAPVCPCMMPAHNARKLADFVLTLLSGNKPRVRVPCGRRVIDAEPA